MTWYNILAPEFYLDDEEHTQSGAWAVGSIASIHTVDDDELVAMDFNPDRFTGVRPNAIKVTTQGSGANVYVIPAQGSICEGATTDGASAEIPFDYTVYGEQDMLHLLIRVYHVPFTVVELAIDVPPLPALADAFWTSKVGTVEASL